ncbi:DUF2235 domain-containing protein [Herbaspirillum sp. GCM10030257]|uniref:DUF2235 domain-containing protein n=1 Tax=Herbaspirillum sp. GCM10030257 TaxID=3273393 RepID=UPI00361E23FA
MDFHRGDAMDSEHRSARGRQLIVCCDGTSNTLTGRQHDTNVLKTVELLDPDRNSQKLYYDPGVGAADQMPTTTNWDAFTRHLNRIQGLVSGKGIYENIAGAYQFIVENFTDGDQLYLFGFSRGAFTVRSVSGLINLFGIIRPEHISLIPTMINVYFSYREPIPGIFDKRKEVANQIRDRFTNLQGRYAKIHFIGVWDTVESVGFPLLQTTITSDGMAKTKPQLTHIRHALALDEHRFAFRPRLYWDDNYDENGRSLKQFWFRGAHCDLGGGYEQDDECRLSDDAFWWMMQEAEQAGLRFNAPVPRQPWPVTEDTRCLLVHNECRSNPWWAVTGMMIRNLRPPKDAFWERGVNVGKRSAESELHKPRRADVASNQKHVALKRPGARQWEGLLVACSVAVLMYLVVCWLSESAFTGTWRNLSSGLLTTDLAALAEAGRMFAAWQWRAHVTAPALPDGFSVYYAMWAVIWDFAFIAAYSYVLGFFAAWAFSRLAGLHDVSKRGPRYLRVAGWVPCVAVFADIVENCTTLTMLAFAAIDWTLFVQLTATFVSAASTLKFTMLAASIGMITAGLLPLKADRTRAIDMPPPDAVLPGRS